MKFINSLKFGAAILLALVIDLSRFSTAHADDPAYYKLEDLKELTIYKEADDELRPTFSFETVGFEQSIPVGEKDQSVRRVRQALDGVGGYAWD